MHSPGEIPGWRDAGSIADRQENRLVLRLDPIAARTVSGDHRVDAELGLGSLRKALGLYEGSGIDIIRDRPGSGLVRLDIGSGVEQTLKSFTARVLYPSEGPASSAAAHRVRANVRRFPMRRLYPENPYVPPDS